MNIIYIYSLIIKHQMKFLDKIKEKLNQKLAKIETKGLN